VNIRFPCPACAYPGTIDLAGKTEWRCPQCDHFVASPADPGAELPACRLCGNPELYKKKDFPHGLGLAILTVAILASVVTVYLYQPWLTWAILLGSAAFDGILYLLVGDVVVCYRCNAHHRGFARSPEHKPFELVIAERYRQERLRREQLQKSERQARSASEG
jgi:hypothetical protein